VDGTTWGDLPAPPDFISSTNNLINRFREGFAGPAPDDLLLVALGQVARGRVTLSVAKLGNDGWRDWSEYAGTIPSLGSSLLEPFAAVQDLAANSERAVMVGTATDEAGANAHAVAFTSGPTTFDPEAIETCAPRPARRVQGPS